MRAVAPRKAREFSRCDQLGFLFRGEALSSEQEAARVLQPVFVELQLPRSVPPKVRLDLDTAAQRVSAGQMTRFDRERAGRLPSVQSSVGGLRGERRVDGIVGPRRLHFEACAGAVTQLAPFVGTEDGVPCADRGAGVGQFDLTADAAHEEAGLGHGMRKITRLARQRFLLRLPEIRGRRQQQGGQALGAPIGRTGARIAFGQLGKNIDPTQTDRTLRLADGTRPEKLEVLRAEAAR